MNGSEKLNRVILAPAQIIELFGLPPSLRERISKVPANGPTPEPQAHRSEVAMDEEESGLHRRRVELMESIASLERRVGRIENRKQDLGRELRGLERELELRRSERERLTLDRPYPALGVFTVGFLVAILGLLILLPFEMPSVLRYVLGAGFLLIGFSVLANGILKAKRNPRAPVTTV